ncbi:Fanconi anemia group D2 protein-like [Amphiura filiformis]|uniref:Fanconi anemia group D2 protein-like n=1 Tax=Amphiura filiformis TaxID=82378 RepID=UPI003B21DC74
MAKSRGKRVRGTNDQAAAGASKRSRKGQGDGDRGAQKDRTVLQDTSVFGELTKQAGFVMMAGDLPNELSVDQALFVKNLTRAVKRHDDFPQVVDDFVAGVQNHIEDAVRFKYSLLPTITAANCESARGGSQDSLMRLLLGIDDLQSPLIVMLLEKLPEFMGDEDSMFDYSESANLPSLILNQFKWLDRVINSKEMTDKMLDMVDVSCESVQREIVACIPEVVSDEEHNAVANKLQELLVQNSQLTVPILDALTNLNLTPELTMQARTAALQTLASAELEDLPAVVKFILQSVTSTDATEVISELRNNLDLHSMLPPTTASTPQRRPRTNASKEGDCKLLILETIKSNICFWKAVTEGWVKAIESVDSTKDHKALDIIVLIIIHYAAPDRKKSVESVFRNKIRMGHLSEILLQATFSSHAQAIREYFPSILSLAEVLLRSPEPTVSLYACSMYKQAFLAFDMYCRQEVVGALVAHISSGFEAEVDAALDVLTELVETNASDLAQFVIFIKGMLDYLDNLSMPQIRKLFAVLSALAFGSGSQDTALIQDELHIVIRKQLSSNSPKYKRIGVIGALMIVRNMARKTPATPGGASTSTGQTDSYRQVTNLLDDVKNSSNKMPEAMALFFDELATIIEKRQLNSKIESWIGDTILEDFQEDFVVDIEAEYLRGDFGLTMAELYGLEAEDSQGSIAVNLLPLVSKAERAHLNNSMISNTGDAERNVSPLCLAPHFRLLRVCEQVQNNGNLDGIDALLGCPMYVVKEDVIEKVDSLSRPEKELVCTCLFMTLNWFRELLNAFASLADPEMRAKVLGRLQNLTHVQELLEICLAATPGFLPPTADFGSDTALNAPSLPSTGGGGKKGKKDKEKDLNETNADATQNATIQETQPLKSPDKADSETTDKATVPLSQYRVFFRELDLDVFTVLSCGLLSRTVLDSNMHTKEVEVMKLHPPQLEFLLEDLTLKLEHALIASASKRRTFLKTKSNKGAGFSHLDQHTPRQVAKKIVKLLSSLCDHMEATSGFFQALIEQNDGLMDGPGSNTPESQIMGRCLELLLRCMCSLFAWNGFVSHANKELLEEALGVLNARMKGTSQTQFTFKQLISNSFQYLEKFSETIPKLSTAVILVKLLVSLSDKYDDPADATRTIANLAQGFLQREWIGSDGQKEKGAKNNEMIQTLIKIFFLHTTDVLKCIQDICSIAVPELLDADKYEGSTTYPTLTKSAFGTYYRMMLDELVRCVRQMTPGKPSDPIQQSTQLLVRWNMAVRVFHTLVTLIKAFDVRSNLNAALKFGRMFIELFLRNGMPLLDKVLRTNKDDVMGLLKNLQQSTRTMHHVCSHSKVAKDVSLINHVPLLKKALEGFVFRVKAMLTLHNCQEAFWMGNLKNRDLHGEEILSQVSNAESEAESDGGEESEDNGPELSDDSDEEQSTTAGDDETEAGREDAEGSGSEESYSESF